MRRVALVTLGVCAAIAACSTFGGGDDNGTPAPDAAPDVAPPPPPPPPQPASPPPSDGGVDAAVCDTKAQFNKPVPVGGVNNGVAYGARLSQDEQTIFYATGTPARLMVARRSDPKLPAFTGNQPVNGTNGGPGRGEEFPAPTPDGTLLYYDVVPTDGTPGDLYVSTLLPDGGTAGETFVDAGIVGAAKRFTFATSTTLWFARGILSASDIFFAERASTSVSPATVVNELVTGVEDSAPVPTEDLLTLYFKSARTDLGGPGGDDIFVATRAKTTDKWGQLRNMTEINSAASDFPTWISPDGCRLYLSSNKTGSFQIYVASR
jgi:hypothetical protein